MSRGASRLLTNYGVAGNLDAPEDGRGDSVDAHAFVRSMHEFEAEHARQRDALTPRIVERLDAYRTEKARLLGADRLRQRHELSSRRGEQLRRLADVQALQRLREPVARDVMRLVHGDRELPIGEAINNEDVPEVIRTHSHNPPFATSPPYPWSWTTFHHWFSSGSSQVTNWWLDAEVGKVGHRVAYSNFSPGDSDWCDTEARSLIGFSVPPQGSAKKWKFWITVACGAARGLFDWEDEYGSSITHNYMLSNMRIAISTDPETPNLLHHPFERFKIWNQNWHGDDDWHYLFEFKPNGWTWTYVWTTPFVLPNQSASVSIGTADYTSYWLDDVELDNVMNNRWAITNVAIELVN
jgi:hypothetical protein